MEKFYFIDQEISDLKEKGLFNIIRTIESAKDAWIVVNGKKVFDMCSNDYLGMANHPEIKKKVKETIDKFGIGPAAVRSIAGTMSLHLELEEKLAKFKGVEACISFQSGLLANLGTIPAIVSEGDAIFSDELNHASIIDGCRLTKATRHIYKHRDVNSLEEEIKKEKNARRKLIVTDGVFSMDGDLAPLPEIAEIAEKYQAIVMVDDAHGEGVLGEHGRGIVDHFKLHGKIDIEMGTMSKAFGVIGGYIASNEKIVSYLKQRARPFLFSSAATVADVAACIAVVDLLQRSDELVKKLWDNAKYFKKEMKSLGFDIGQSETPITPVMLNDEKLTREFSKRLFDSGVFAIPITYPTVPLGKARIRVMLSAKQEKKDLDFALGVFEKVGKEMKVLLS
ncbi:MAG: glycine C-acetyltransferase [Candidatus Altiarchaeota archaeon]